MALGGGGYELVDVVPRSWTHLAAIAAHVPVPLDTAVPQSWRDHVREITGREGPATMGDLEPGELPIWVQPWEMGHNPDRPVDAASSPPQAASAHGATWFD